MAVDANRDVLGQILPARKLFGRRWERIHRYRLETAQAEQAAAIKAY
jgi:hypothetical protein